MQTALIDGDRYVYVNRVGEHRLVAAQALGRFLAGQELVHHVDYNKRNNQPNNLVVCPDDSYHKLLHARTDVLNDGYHPDLHHYCSHHKRYEFKEAFSTRRSWNGLHNMCREATNEYRKETGINKDKFDWRARLNQQYRRVFNQHTKREVCGLSKEGRSL